MKLHGKGGREETVINRYNWKCLERGLNICLYEDDEEKNIYWREKHQLLFMGEVSPEIFFYLW